MIGWRNTTQSERRTRSPTRRTRRRLCRRARLKREDDAGLRRRLLEPLAHREVARGSLARAELGDDLGDSGRSARRRRCGGGSSRGSPGGRARRLPVPRSGVALGDLADHLAHAVLDEAGLAVRLLDDAALVGALHQLVDLRATSTDSTMRSRSRASMLDVGALGAADVEGADAALVVGRDGDGVEDALDLVVGEACSDEALAGAVGRRRPWAQGQAVMPWASTPVRVRVPRSEATAVPKSV